MAVFVWQITDITMQSFEQEIFFSFCLKVVLTKVLPNFYQTAKVTVDLGII